MIDIKALEKDPTFVQEYRQSLKDRGADASAVDNLLELNSKRKSYLTQMETARAEQNRVGQEIARRKREKEEASELLSQMQELSGQVKDFDKLAQEVSAELELMLLSLPNRLHSSVPLGDSAEDNEVIKEVGPKREFSFPVKDHVALGETLGILDFERAGKVTGARFAFLKGAGAQLERALIQFMMDCHSQRHGYAEMIPPFIVNSQSLQGTGNFPKFKQDVFHLSETDYYLVPTAEVPVTNYYAEEILDEKELPLRYCAYSPCFRSEAGSHGKDTRGLIRQHQFNKVELMIFSHPDQSYDWHEKLTAHAEQILQDLELAFRRVSLCSKDIGFGAAKCFDLEVWLPGPSGYREISSCSNFEDFQARRANIRYRPEGKGAKPRFVHTLNGSGLAVGRTLIAILENYQQDDGSILIPEALRAYMGGRDKIPASQKG